MLAEGGEDRVGAGAEDRWRSTSPSRALGQQLEAERGGRLAFLSTKTQTEATSDHLPLVRGGRRSR